MLKQTFFVFILSIISLSAMAQNGDITRSVWANEAIVATYTYQYSNFLERQKEIAKYFTADAWMAYSKALTASQLPETIQKNNYMVSAVATDTPTVTSIADGQWKAQMPLLVVYQNPQYQQKQTLDVTITFKAAPSGQGVRGLAITSLQSKVIKPACKCDVDSTPSMPAQ